MDPSARFGAIPPHPGPRAGGHRRAQSETFLRLPDDILFDPDDFSIELDFPSLSDDGPVPGDNGRSESSSGGSRPSGGIHTRSLSMDAAFFDGIGIPTSSAFQERKPGHHRRSGSMDGTTSPFEGESALTSDYAKKAMAADKLAELALIDPKRAKRILANRQSAARSKERKIRYTSELERKVQTLQTEATTLSAQLTLLQRDTTGLTAENRELKLRLQAMEQQAHLRDALNDALRDEVQRLKIATGQIPNMNGTTLNRGLPQSASPYFTHHQQLHNQSGHPNQQLHGSQPSPNGQALSDQSLHDSMDFM
ncbi:hypothetical protein J5N97_012016 [Dioscorea zingiberensis]|uniref:BZIP domain-containing protein n=1 Tax=Dioscorea zingiberensis TaxID=325984 RepID=A0A9D5CQB0_9LILI|nr:hypothetical protein J5N97_012016 [Dioscorea zingiberensis]